MDKRTWIIAFIIFTNMLGVGIIFPLLPYYAQTLGASIIAIGFLSSMYPLFQLASAPLIGNYSDKHGRRPALLFSLAGTVLGFILLGIGGSLPILFLARIIDGASAGNFPTAFAYIADITDEKQRTQAMGAVNAASWLGFVLGPALGGVLSQYGYATPAYLAAVIAGIGLILAYCFLPETIKERTQTLKKQHLFNPHEFMKAFQDKKIAGFLLIALCIELALWLMNGTIAFFVKDAYHYTPAQYGYLNAYYSAIGILTQLLILKMLTKKLSERDIFTITSLTIAVSLFLYTIGRGNNMLVLTTTLFGFGSSMVNPLLTSIISKASSPQEQGSRMGVIQTISSIATLAGPIIATAVYTINIRIPYLLGSIISLVAVCISAFSASKIRTHLTSSKS
jgi:DHA1 family tetracycline resistance protein-like MFS transporter